MAKITTGAFSVFRVLIKSCLISLMFINSSFAIQVTDDTGKLLQLEKPAQRVISLVPHATEMLYRVGAGSQVVGVTEYSDYPEAAKALPLVGNFSHLNIEAVLALKPDLVVVWGKYDDKPEYQQLIKLGFKVFYSEPHSVEGIASNLRALGILTGHEQLGQQQARLLLDGFNDLKEKYTDVPVLKVFYQVWHSPLMTVNGKGFIASVVRTCGGQHLFAEEPISAPQVNMEAVLALDPEVIITGGRTKEQAGLDHWQDWPSITAVKHNNLFAVEADLIQRPTFRLLEGASRLCAFMDKARKNVSSPG